ncbi:hypothetical protein BRD06_00420 [Halobacteriales archaeon QS_9_67_15]|nr:MAG: hypothetical protein BRD06_00420 [Halobacteriales archaeon QS_9_67_15]
MQSDRDKFSRDLPAPPRRSRDNYASAVAEVYRALNEAELVAPDGADRQFVDEGRGTVRAELLDAIEDVEDTDAE